MIQRLTLLVRSLDGAVGFREGFEPLDRGKALQRHQWLLASGLVGVDLELFVAIGSYRVVTHHAPPRCEDHPPPTTLSQHLTLPHLNTSRLPV